MVSILTHIANFCSSPKLKSWMVLRSGQGQAARGKSKLKLETGKFN